MVTVEELRNALWRLLDAESRYRHSIGGRDISVDQKAEMDLSEARRVALELLAE